MKKYTLDQGFIQDNKTGEFHTHIEVDARCKAFSNLGIAGHKLRILASGEVMPFDFIAGHFTTCHALSRRTQRRIFRKFID